MAWVTKDSTETYNQTPEPPREYTKTEKAANWWHYHWGIVVIVVLCGLPRYDRPVPPFGRTVRR